MLFENQTESVIRYVRNRCFDSTQCISHSTGSEDVDRLQARYESPTLYTIEPGPTAYYPLWK